MLLKKWVKNRVFSHFVGWLMAWPKFTIEGSTRMNKLVLIYDSMNVSIICICLTLIITLAFLQKLLKIKIIKKVLTTLYPPVYNGRIFGN